MRCDSEILKLLHCFSHRSGTCADVGVLLLGLFFPEKQQPELSLLTMLDSELVNKALTALRDTLDLLGHNACHVMTETIVCPGDRLAATVRPCHPASCATPCWPTSMHVLHAERVCWR